MEPAVCEIGRQMSISEQTQKLVAYFNQECVYLESCAEKLIGYTPPKSYDYASIGVPHNNT